MHALDVTMIAFYGKPKPAPLEKLLADVLGVVAANLPSSVAWSFDAYTFAQMHATMIGMEVDVRNGQRYGHWFQENWNEARLVNVIELHSILGQLVNRREDPLFTIRFGGFAESHCRCVTDHPNCLDRWECASCPTNAGVFHSCDRTPYDASFYSTPGPLIITGWPVNGPDGLESFPHNLYEFRRSLEIAGFSDKYHYARDHKWGHWKDDDCFVKIGTFSSPTSEAQRSAIDAAVRDYLSNRKPITVDITTDNVSIVLYDDPSLEESRLRARVALKDFLCDFRTVEKLYADVLAQRAG